MKNVLFHQMYQMHQKIFFDKLTMIENYGQDCELSAPEKELLNKTRIELKAQFDKDIADLMVKFSKGKCYE